jgi:hypothetical protein
MDVVLHPPVFTQLRVKTLKLLCRGQFAVDQKVGGFFVSAVPGEVNDAIAAVREYALLAIQVGDPGPGCGDAFKPWLIVSHITPSAIEKPKSPRLQRV